MAKYDGLIIPRSYNDYINKSDPAGVAQALQLTGVMDNAPTAQSTKPAKSGGIFAANAVIMANNKTLSGVAISTGSVVRVLFTAALTGSDATTGLTLTYNGNTYAVKVGKNGALANFLANNIDGSYIYCQAYTTLELMFDGSQFIIMGNPVVISSADYTIYTDGKRIYSKWIFVQTELGTNEITLPLTWTELLIYVNHSDSNVGGTLIINKALLDFKQYFTNLDWKNMNNNIFTQYRVKIQNNKISLFNSIVDGVNDTSTAQISVYFR